MTYSVEEQRAAREAGNYNHVSRETFQPIDRHNWLVPTIQQAIESTALGVFVFVAGIVAGVVMRYMGIPDIGLEVFGVSLGVGALVGLYNFWRTISKRFTAVGDAVIKREVMERETRKAAASSASTVRIEWWDAGSEEHPYGRAVWDELGVSRETLAIACNAERLSKSGLKAVGLDGGVSLSLLTQFFERQYIVRPKQNKPAQWTSKGKALKRAFTDEGPPLDVGG